jgi:hypothetical protein
MFISIHNLEMKQLLFCALSIVLFCAAACTKKDLESNYWTIAGTKVIALNVARVPSANTYLQSTNGSNTFVCRFSTFPTSSGAYKIVTSDSLPHGGEMAVTAIYNGLAYGSTGHDKVYAAVVITSGKISIELPEIWVASKNDSVKLSASVSEF